MAALSAGLTRQLKLLIKTNQRARLAEADVPSARLRKKLQQKPRSRRSQVTVILAVRAAALSARRPRKKLRRLIAARRARIHPPAPALTPKRIVVAVAKKMVTHLRQMLRSRVINKSLI